MSTETVAEKRRLSKSSIDSDKDVSKVTTVEDIEISQQSDTTNQLDEQEAKQGHNPDENKQVGKSSDSTKVERDKVPTNISSNNVIPGDGSRQIIAVSANKNPTAFFQLARKFLMTNEMCDLSALEGAIVSAVDAAHLLERSKLASIVRIHTSYVNVEPKRRRQVSQQRDETVSVLTTKCASSNTTMENASSSFEAESSLLNNIITDTTNMEDTSQASSSAKAFVSSSIPVSKKSMKVSGAQQTGLHSVTASSATNAALSSSASHSRELRRARILLTVKRTESYKRWLEENPTQRQAIIAGTASVTAEDIVGDSSRNED